MTPCHIFTSVPGVSQPSLFLHRLPSSELNISTKAWFARDRRRTGKCGTTLVVGQHKVCALVGRLCHVYLPQQCCVELGSWFTRYLSVGLPKKNKTAEIRCIVQAKHDTISAKTAGGLLFAHVNPRVGVPQNFRSNGIVHWRPGYSRTSICCRFFVILCLFEVENHIFSLSSFCSLHTQESAIGSCLSFSHIFARLTYGGHTA